MANWSHRSGVAVSFRVPSWCPPPRPPLTSKAASATKRGAVVQRFDTAGDFGDALAGADPKILEEPRKRKHWRDDFIPE